jgi:hypothetical protein
VEADSAIEIVRCLYSITILDITFSINLIMYFEELRLLSITPEERDKNTAKERVMTQNQTGGLRLG